MAVFSPVIHAMRVSLEGAMTHIRPPASSKPALKVPPGGHGAKRSRPRPRVTVEKPHLSSASAESPNHQVPQDVPTSTLAWIVASVIKHAIAPVFVELRTAPRGRAVGSFMRSTPARTFSQMSRRPMARPYRSESSGMSWQLATVPRNFRPGPNADIIFSTENMALGFRAAFDQLKEESRRGKGEGKSAHPRRASTGISSSSVSSSASLRNHWNAAQQVEDSDRSSTSLSLSALLLEQDDFSVSPVSTPSCFSSSSSSSDGLSETDPTARPASPFGSDSGEEYIANVPVPPRRRTMIQIPVPSHDLIPAPEDDNDGVLHGFRETVERLIAHRLRHIEPLLDALSMGRVSQFGPHDSGVEVVTETLPDGEAQRSHFVTSVFARGDAGEIYSALRQDLPDWDPQWLQSLLYEENALENVEAEEDAVRVEGDFVEEQWEAQSVDVANSRRTFGAASRHSESQHGQGLPSNDPPHEVPNGFPIGGTEDDIHLRMPRVSNELHDTAEAHIARL